jgi:CubicO group peptidase (beta-lactamase class C family)
VVSEGEPVLTKGYGYADVSSQNPVQADQTAFRVGSVGKLITFSAVMQNVARGRLDLDEDINTYLEDSEVSIPETYDSPVTLDHLGTHTAGFEPKIDPELVSSPDDVQSLETVLRRNDRQRVRPPGDAVAYSNYGAALAGHIVAEATDTEFEQYVQSNVFEPLGMNQSTFSQPRPETTPGELATGHESGDDSFQAGDEVYINMRPAGSMSATVTDMASFMSVHLGGSEQERLLFDDGDTLEAMHDVHHVRHPAVNNWRYGFHEYGPQDVDLISHSGGTQYFTSRLVLAPKQDLGIFLTYNINGESPSVAVDEILRKLGVIPDPSPEEETNEPGQQGRIETVTGEYKATFLPRSGPMRLADLLARISVESDSNGHLVTSVLGEGERKWKETAPFVFEEIGGHDVLAFEVSDDESVVMNMSSTPQGVHHPVNITEQQLVTGGLLGTSLSGMTLSLLGRGGKKAWNRVQDRTEQAESKEN